MTELLNLKQRIELRRLMENTYPHDREKVVRDYLVLHQIYPTQEEIWEIIDSKID
jgi:hypothetical protein